MNNNCEVKSVLDLPIEEMEFSERVLKRLKDAGFETVGDLVEHDAEQLAEAWGINDTYLREILENLTERGVSLPAKGKPVTETQKIGAETDVSTLDLPIEDLSLPFRAEQCLKRAGIQTIGDVLEHSDLQLLEVRNFNVKCLRDLVVALDHFGLELPEHGTPVN